MNGQVTFNQPLSGLLYKISGLQWSASDNKLTVFVGLYVTENDAAPLVQRAYYIPIQDQTLFDSLTGTINGMLKAQIEADGMFTVEPFPAGPVTPAVAESGTGDAS